MASPFLIDHPSPPLPSPIKSIRHIQSVEAFPDFQSTSTIKHSPASNAPATSASTLDGQTGPKRPNRQFRTPSQLLPSTALLPSSRNASHNDLTSSGIDHNRDRDDHSHQRLPRAAPAPSLAGPSIRPTSSIAPGLLRGSIATMGRPQPNAEELKSESLWADMQRTLADVELSAMKSSHLFNAPHSHSLEKLRDTQLALAQAWARSEAVETAGQESEDDFLDSELEGGIQASTLSPRGGTAKGRGGKDNGISGGTKPENRRSRQGSAASSLGKDLEEETEKDIRLARKRREANDRYFSQVNRGVLDVVARLDEVAAAMRSVEKESRAVWDEMARGDDGSTTGSATDLDLGTNGNERIGLQLRREVSRYTNTTETGTGTGSGTELSESPITPRKHRGTLESVMEGKSPRRTSKERGG